MTATTCGRFATTATTERATRRLLHRRDAASAAGRNGKEFKLSRERGFAFESDFVCQASERGHRAFRVKGQKPHDVVVDGVRVQCKSKQFDEQGRVRIAKGQKKYRRGDWDVLALDFRGTLYLIPESILRTSKGTLLTVIRPRLFRKWIDAWEVFCDARLRNAPLVRTLFDSQGGVNGR